MFGLSIMVIVAGVVMILAFVGMLFCAKLQRSQPNVKGVAVFLLAIIIVCGFFIMKETMSSNDEELIKSEMKYARAAAVILGREVASRSVNSNVLVIANSQYQNNERQQELIDGLKEGMGGTTKNLHVETLEPKKNTDAAMNEGMGMPEEMIMVEEMMTAKDFDALIDKYPDVDVCVSLIGLPEDFYKMKVWTKDKPKMAVLLFSGSYPLHKAIAKGKIIAVATYRPGVKFSEEPAPDLPEKAFEMRYILITPENVKEIAREHPSLFKLRGQLF